MRVVVVTPPAPIVTPEEAAAHLRLDDLAAERDYVEGLISAATATIDGPDGWLGRAIGLQVLEARFSLIAFDRSVRLPCGPVVELDSIRYLDMAGTEHVADLVDFDLVGDEVVPEGSSFMWEGGSVRREAGRIRYRAGSETVPPAIKSALLLMVGDLYRFRETVSGQGGLNAVPISTPVQAMLRPFRNWSR